MRCRLITSLFELVASVDGFRKVLSIMSHLMTLSNTITDYNECVFVCVQFCTTATVTRYSAHFIITMKSKRNENNTKKTRTQTKTMGERSSKIIANSGTPNEFGVDFSAIRVESQT